MFLLKTTDERDVLKDDVKRKLEVKYLDLSVSVVRWEVWVLWLVMFALGQKGLSTIHNNPWELRRNPSTPVPVREFLSRSWIRADCGSRLPIIPVIELRGSQIKAHNTCDNVGHTSWSCIITGIGQNLQNIEKTTEFMFSFLTYINHDSNF